MLNSAIQMLKMTRKACRNVRICCTIPTTLLRPVRQWSLLLSYQLHSYEKGIWKASSSVPPAACWQAGSFCLQPLSRWHRYILDRALGMEQKMTSLLPCFQRRVGSPCSSPTSPTLLNHTSHSLWCEWLLELSVSFVLITSFQSCLQGDTDHPLQTSKQLLTRGDASPTSVGKSLCLTPDCLPPLVISLQLGTFQFLLLAKDMGHSLCMISGSPC